MSTTHPPRTNTFALIGFIASFVSPGLTMSHAPGALTLQWPAWAAPFTVWSTTNLAPPVTWTQVTNMPATNGEALYLTLPNAGESSFYRLQFP